MILTGKNLEVMDMNYKTASYMAPMSLGKHFSLLLAAILALLLAACGGADGGNNGTASANKANKDQCTLTQAQIDALTPADALPPGCDFLAISPIVGLFILGTEIDIATGELKLYVNGVKRNGTPMILTDFEGAAVTVGGVTVNRPADWNVVAAGGDVLSLVTLADYSASISTADLIGMGDVYDVVLENARTDFEAETINFTTNPNVPYIVTKPEPLPNESSSWTTDLAALKTANNYDAAFPNQNTPLYDAMGTGLMGPLDDAYNASPGDGLGLVERNRPANLIMVQTDGVDNASLKITEDDLVSLMDRCHTTAIMVGTFQADADINKILEGRASLERLAGTRGAFVNALNASFLEAAITPFAESLGNLVVFTLSQDTLFADRIVTIEVDNLAASAEKPFNIPAGCQVPGWTG
jgi:hypothetical protein